MFQQGSRYFGLPQARRLDADGEWRLGVDLRLIPRTAGQFLHTVTARERLDLLAFRYYSDPRKWWLIADANPDRAFPPDLIDAAPVVEEVFTVERPDFLGRAAALRVALASFGEFRESGPDFFVGRMTVDYAAATTRGLITDEIARLGFHLIDSFSWPGRVGTAEAFTFEDRPAKRAWNALVKTLSAWPGSLDVHSVGAGETFRMVYNETQLSRETIRGRVESQGFTIDPWRSGPVERLGAQITIPPNQA